MNKDLSQIKGYFKIEQLRNDKRLIAFLICLLIASALWFLNALNKEYSTVVSYPVKYINPPKNQFLANTPPNKFDLKVEAYGFTLLRHKLSLSFSPIVLNISNITSNIESNSGSYTVNTSGLIRRVSDQVSSEINISEIQPDYFVLRLDTLTTKSVPVEYNISTEFKPEFNLKLPVSSNPAMVNISGPSTVLDTIHTIKTKKKIFTKIDTDINKEIELDVPTGVTVSTKKVELKIAVEKFTEKELTIPINILNKPENVNIKLFPSEVKVLFTVGLSEFDNINATDFSVQLDYNEIEYSSEFLDVAVENKTQQCKLIRYSPERVEFLIETTN